MRHVFLLSIALAMCACNGKTPVSGTVPMDGVLSTQVSLVDARTGQAPAGSVVLNASIGETVTISIPNFLVLRTPWQGTPLTLWPADPNLPVEFTRSLIYRNEDGGQLHRWPSSTKVLRIQPRDVFVSGKLRQDLEMAVQIISAQHPSLDFVVSSSGGDVTIGTDSNDPYWKSNSNAFGVAYVDWRSNGSIKEGRILFRNASEIQRYADNDWMLVFLLHEIGHTTGLDHLHSSFRGVMAPFLAPGEWQGFTEVEQLAMRLQYLRRPGTRLTGMMEDESMASASTAGTYTTVTGD